MHPKTNKKNHLTSLLDPIVQKKIIKGFSKAASTYDHHSELQQQTGLNLLGILKKLANEKTNNKSFQTILDLGCGTGWLTEKIFATYQPQAMWGIDISPEMINYAKEKHPHSQVKYVVCSATDKHFSPVNKFDLIIANMSLQWVQPLGDVFKNCSSLLTPGGVLACSFMLKGTFFEWREMYQKVTGHLLPEWLLSPEAITKPSSFLNKNFPLIYSQVEMKKKTFVSLKDFAHHQRSIGATNPFSHEQQISKSEYLSLEKSFQKNKNVTYNLGFFVWQNKRVKQ